MKKLACLITILFSMMIVSCGPTGGNDNNHEDSHKNEYEDTKQYEIYLLAKEAGFKGEFEDWVYNIQGTRGKNGKQIVLKVRDGNIMWHYEGEETLHNIFSVNDLLGPRGENGKSAYEVYLQEHPEYNKTEKEWIDEIVSGKIGNRNNTYVVSFDTKTDQKIEEQVVYDFTNAVEPTAPVKEGYVFKGWYVNDDLWNFEEFYVTNDIHLEAKYDLSKFKIEYDLGNKIETEEAYYNDVIDNIPTKEGYYFKYFLDEKNNKINVPFNVKKDLNLKAVFDNKYKIIVKNEKNEVLQTFDKLHGELIETLPVLENKEDKQFLGWYYDNNNMINYVGNSLFCDYGIEEITLYPKWGYTSNNFVYSKLNNEDTYQIDGYIGALSNIDIPDKINGKDIVKIGDNAFNNLSVEKIVLPNTIKEIGKNVFCGLDNLNVIYLSNNLVKVNEGAFKNLSKDIRIIYNLDKASFDKIVIEKDNDILKENLIISNKEIKNYDFSNIKANDATDVFFSPSGIIGVITDLVEIDTNNPMVVDVSISQFGITKNNINGALKTGGIKINSIGNGSIKFEFAKKINAVSFTLTNYPENKEKIKIKIENEIFEWNDFTNNTQTFKYLEKDLLNVEITIIEGYALLGAMTLYEEGDLA